MVAGCSPVHSPTMAAELRTEDGASAPLKGRPRLDAWSALFIAEALVFLVFKGTHLQLPNYWDEAWVYYPAVAAMAEAGPSLSPAAIPTDLSRGHPLLFHFLGALWMKLFGISRISGHSFALALATALATVTFLIGKRVQGTTVGWAAATMVLVNEAFLAQSAMLLPEVMLALFALLTLWAFVERSFLWFITAGCCTVLTKESGIVLMVAVLCWLLICALGKGGRRDRATWAWMGSCLVPIGVLALFLLVQQRVHGWFLFPDHVGLVTWDVQDIVYKLKLGYHVLCEAQGLEAATYAFGIVGPILLYRRDWKRALPVLLLFITAIKVLFGRWSLGQEGALIVPLLCFTLLLVVYIRPFAMTAGRAGEVVAVSLISVIGMLSFTALNFFSDRYLLFAVPLFALLVTVFLHRVSSDLGRLPFALMASLLIGIAGVRIGHDRRIADTRLTYINDIEARRSMADDLRARGLQAASIRCSFMDSVYLNDPSAGYIPGPERFTGAHVLASPMDSLWLVSGGESAMTIEGDTLVQHRSGPARSVLLRLPYHSDLDMHRSSSFGP